MNFSLAGESSVGCNESPLENWPFSNFCPYNEVYACACALRHAYYCF